jgi:tetratricopeptide (TPR) repeat protein
MPPRIALVVVASGLRTSYRNAIFALVICGSSMASLAQKAEDPLGSAAAAIRAGQYDSAIVTMQHAIAEHASDPRLWTLEGIAYSMKGDDAHALTSLNKALALRPGFQRALQAKASVLSRRRDPAVVPVLKEILAKDPTDSTAREMLGLAEAQAGDCSAALGDFAQVGPALAAHADSLQYQGACLLESKAYPQAVAAFEQLRTLRPGDSGAVYDLAAAQFEAGQAQQASASLAPLLEHAPDVDTLVLGADIAEEIGDTPKAAALLRQAILADPARSNSYVRFAELCMSHESYQAGIDMVSAGLSRQPHDAMLFLARGLLYGGLAEYDKAEADFRSAERYDPQHGTGAYAVGVIEAQREDPDKALATVRGALKQHPEDAQLQFLLARLLVDAGAKPGSPVFDEALQAAEKAVKLKPDLGAAHDLLSRIYLEAARPAEAIDQCRASLAINPDDGQALYRLMRALRVNGRADEAKTVARQVAAQHDRAREQEATRLRYRIQTGAPTDPNSSPQR